jgi:hypothetical protein
MYVPEYQATGDCATSFTLDRGQAREHRTTYTDEYLFRPQNIGHLYDKTLALQALTADTAYFYRDFSNLVDRGAFSISYYRVFQPEMIDLLTNLVIGNTSSYAAQVALNGDVEVVNQPLVKFRTETYDEDAGPKIKPSESYRMRRLALYWAMVGFSSTVDQTLDLAARSKISVVGSPNDPIQEGVPEVIFTDPVSGVQYRAYAPDGESNSLGYRILKDAQDFVTSGAYAQAKALKDLATTPEELEVADEAFASAEGDLNEKLEIISQVRLLTDLLEFGQTVDTSF